MNIKIMEENKHTELPDSLLSKLYDRTGTTKGGNKGFYLFYINAEGDPTCITKFENNASRMGVQKGIEVLIKDAEESDIFTEDFDLDLDD
jgi:hypothetical protein